MKRSAITLAATLLVMGVGTDALGADPTYTVKALTQFTEATAINNAGDIVGWREYGTGVLLRSGQTVAQPIGSLGGTRTYPRAINDLVQIVGDSTLAADSEIAHAFLHSNGVMHDLGVLPDHVASRATAINAKGQIAGWSSSASVTLPFIYSGGAMTPIRALGGRSASAIAITDRGMVVGNAEFVEMDGTPPLVTRPFTYTSQGMAGLAGMGGNNASAYGVNANNVIVGTAEPYLDNLLTRAAAWWSWRPEDLGTLPGDTHSVATGINKNSYIVGYSYKGSDVPEARRAFLHFSGSMFDLDGRLATSAWRIRTAIAINDGGQILAEGCSTSAPDNCGPLLLTPVSNTSPKPPRKR